MTPGKFDIAVIGSGPAGSSAALRAARHGARVLLLEKQPMPRPKLCGGWVSEHAISFLERPLPEHLTSCPFKRVNLTFRDVSQQYEPSENLGAFVDRGAFDAHLNGWCQEEGVRCVVQRATSVDVSDRQHTIHTDMGSWVADATILAVGANSSLVNTVRPPDTASESSIAVEQRLSTVYADRWELEPGDGYIGFGVVNFGYEWALHHGDYLLVGVGARRAAVANIRSLFREFWNRWRIPAEEFGPTGHPIPLGGVNRRLGRGRLLCAGDAAGLVDPFNGEGIAAAIQSGQLAADALLDEHGETSLDAYERSVRDTIWKEFRAARQMAQLFNVMPDTLIRWFCSDPNLATSYHDVIRHRRSYASFVYEISARATTRRTVQAIFPAMP